MKTINLPNLNVVASKDDLRPAMQYIKFDGYIATATDGHILVRINLERELRDFSGSSEFLDGKMIHWKVWNEINKSYKLIFEEDRIVSFREDFTVEFPYNKIDTEYPKFLHVLEHMKLSNLKELNHFNMNPKYIGRVYEALGIRYNGMSSFFLFGEKKSVLIVNDDVDGFGIVMPGIIQIPKQNIFNNISPLLEKYNPYE